MAKGDTMIDFRQVTDKFLLDRASELDAYIEVFGADIETSEQAMELEAIEHELDARDLALQDDIAAHTAKDIF